MVELDVLLQDCQVIAFEPGSLSAAAVENFLAKHSLESIYRYARQPFESEDECICLFMLRTPVTQEAE